MRPLGDRSSMFEPAVEWILGQLSSHSANVSISFRVSVPLMWQFKANKGLIKLLAPRLD